VRIDTIALHDIESVECSPGLVSCSLHIMGREGRELLADGIFFGDAIHLIMLLGYSRVRPAQDVPQQDSIVVTSIDGRHRLSLTRNTLRYEGQSSWEVPLTRLVSIKADSAGARSTLLFETADTRAYATDALQSSGTLRLLLAMAEMLQEQPTTILESSAGIKITENSPVEGSGQVVKYPTDPVTRTMRMSRKNRRHAPRTPPGKH
jgi:hypothetical protein